MKWVSETIDLTTKGYGNHNEHLVVFHEAQSNEILVMRFHFTERDEQFCVFQRMILRVDTYQESFRATLYSPFWIVNCTDLELEFKVDNDITLVNVGDSPFLVCPKKIDNEVHNRKVCFENFPSN